MADNEQVVLTPSKKGRTTKLKIERVKRLDLSEVVHEGGGQNKGLVVNKQATEDADDSPPQLQLEFKCWMIDRKTDQHLPERRVLKFWFVEEATYLDRVTTAYEFFRELVQPDDFPREYVQFIKKCMKQMQSKMYLFMRKVDVELTLLTQEEAEQEYHYFRDTITSLTHYSNQSTMLHTSEGQPMSVTEGTEGMEKKDKRTEDEILEEQVLYVLESAYPNVLGLEDVVRITESNSDSVMTIMQNLRDRDLVQYFEDSNCFGRKVKMGEETQESQTMVGGQLPMQMGSRDNKPTIAIITAHYYEKLAVDAMMEEKTTYMRYQTQGESNVYTIGYIGNHKVVTTKLASIGKGRASEISSGNATTRLLGSFADVEHVILVGTAGGVPHFTNFYKHPRLGDVVVSTPNDKGYLYIQCKEILQDSKTGEISFSLKTFAPRDNLLQDLVHSMQDDVSNQWQDNITEGQSILTGQEVSFERPPPETDRVYMAIGDQGVIEVQHPPAPPEVDYNPNRPMVRLGAIGSGKILRRDAMRQDFAYRHGIFAFDGGFDQVLEGVIGNCKHSFVVIRSIVDYADGSKKEWYPYAALTAAAYTKALIQLMPTEED